jgi:hypothetical protein
MSNPIQLLLPFVLEILEAEAWEENNSSSNVERRLVGKLEVFLQL